MSVKSAPALIAATAMLLPIHALSARDALVQEPSSAWQMDYGDDNCTLARSFGTGDDITYFVMAMYAPDDTPTIRIMRKQRPTKANSFLAQFAPDKSYTEVDFPLLAKFGDDLEGVILTLSLRSTTEVEELAEFGRADKDTSEYNELPDWDESLRKTREAEINEFRLQRAFRDDLYLQIGSMGQPMQAMRTCLDELIDHWGIDAQVQRTLSRKPVPRSSPGDWIKPRDYPTGMLVSGYQGLVNFRLIVDATGEPTKCIIQQASKPDEFADVSCRLLMRRAKFEPALDADGNPVRSYWSSTVRFVIP